MSVRGLPVQSVPFLDCHMRGTAQKGFLHHVACLPSRAVCAGTTIVALSSTQMSGNRHGILTMKLPQGYHETFPTEANGHELDETVTISHE